MNFLTGNKIVNPIFKKTDKFTLLVTTFGGSGMSPKAPGTVGSFVTALLVYPLASISFTGCFALLSLLVFFAGIPFVVKALKDTDCKDPGWIVIDEVSGQFMAFALITPEILTGHPWLIAIGFGLFRFFDILKPLGIHQLEKLPGAWGVMADDLLGGFYAALILLGVTHSSFFH